MCLGLTPVAVRSALTRVAAPLLLVIFSLGQFGNALAANRVALVIGNGAYKENPLVNPVNDARAISNALTRFDFKVTTKLDVKRDDIGLMLERFFESISQGDEVVVFYAGHGVQVNGKNYLLATDAKIRSQFDVPRNAINVSELLFRLEDTRAAVKLIFLDACRNNPYTRAFRGEGRRGLARIGGAPSGTLISFATQPGGVAADGNGKNGLYTEQLLAHIDTPNLAIEQMLKRVAASTNKKSGGRQRPWIEGSILGDFVFNFSSEFAQSSNQPAQDLSKIAWEIAQRGDNKASYNAFLREYPKSRYAPLARIRLASTDSTAAPTQPVSNQTSSRPAAKKNLPKDTKVSATGKPTKGIPKLASTKPNREKSVREQWSEWQDSMRVAFDWAMDRKDPEEREAALRAFLKDYAAKNPYSPMSDRYRYAAQVTLARLTNSQAAPVAKKSDSWAQDPRVKKANLAAGRNDFKTAFTLHLALAKEGRLKSMTNTGLYYARGNGTTKSMPDALKWWRKAADRGEPMSQANLSLSYYRGMGVKKNYETAFKFGEASAKQNHTYGMHHLGMLYFKGHGVARNQEKAHELWAKCAEMGDPWCQIQIGRLYRDGVVVEMNIKQAIQWFERASAQRSKSTKAADNADQQIRSLRGG